MQLKRSVKPLSNYSTTSPRTGQQGYVKGFRPGRHPEQIAEAAAPAANNRLAIALGCGVAAALIITAVLYWH